jgi:hypothetical protein
MSDDELREYARYYRLNRYGPMAYLRVLSMTPDGPDTVEFDFHDWPPAVRRFKERGAGHSTDAF